MSYSAKALSIYKDLQSTINSFDENTKIIFVRHGQTDNNALRIVQGRRCQNVPLNYTGIEQAKDVARKIVKLDDIKIDLAFCSPAVRAKQTFEIFKTIAKNINEDCDVLPSRQFELENLHEIDWGSAIDNKNMSECEYQALNDSWFVDKNYSNIIEDSENVEDVFERATNALVEISTVINKLKEDNKIVEAPTVLVVGHGFIFGILLTILAKGKFGLSKKPANGSATMLTITKYQNIITNL